MIAKSYIGRKQIESFCSEPLENIEGYEEAVESKGVYVLHHKKEIELNVSRRWLKDHNLYYNRPASELIFMRTEDHTRLHHKGKKLSDETKAKLSAANIGKPLSEDAKAKITTWICPIKLAYMYNVKKMSMRAIGIELGVTGNTVNRALIRNKIKENKDVSD